MGTYRETLCTPASVLPVSFEVKNALLHAVGKAIADFGLIEAGDRIMVAMSGGKDSYALLLLLEAMRRRAPVEFSLIAVHLDQGQPGHDPMPLLAWLDAQGFVRHLVREDTYTAVRKKIPDGKTPCSMCARLRRAVLYRVSTELGCTKIALGHHRDDALETLLLNLFFAGKLAAMPARLTSDDGAHRVIRPLIYCAEPDLAELAACARAPILPCNLCGSRPQDQRRQMKQLIDRLETEYPSVRQTMLAALGNLQADHLLVR